MNVRVADGKIPDDVEYLYWVGCAGALDERARRTPQAVARLLDAAGVSFAVLGTAESCNGDPARRLRQRVSVPDPGRAEHRHPRWCRRQKGHRPLPPLFQHPVE